MVLIRPLTVQHQQAAEQADQQQEELLVVQAVPEVVVSIPGTAEVLELLDKVLPVVQEILFFTVNINLSPAAVVEEEKAEWAEMLPLVMGAQAVAVLLIPLQEQPEQVVELAEVCM
jgi:hypothetical protein